MALALVLLFLYPPTFHVKKLILPLLLLLSAACQPPAPQATPEQLALADRLALHVAVMPTTDCLPLYVAEQSGLADSLGLQLRLHTYMAQMDVDTALQRGRVRVAYSDLVRMLRLHADTLPLRVLIGGHTRLSLLAAKQTRVGHIHQLAERMVAVSRLSASDLWCDALLDSAFMDPEAVFRPQAHSVRLRAEMMRSNIVDAAMLPQPLDAWLRAEGHPLLATQPADGPQLMAWLVCADSALDARQCQQVACLRTAYDMATQQILQGQHQSLVRTILERDFQIPQQMLDSLAIQLPPSTPMPCAQDLAAAKDFLERRECKYRTIDFDSLIWKTPIAEP